MPLVERASLPKGVVLRDVALTLLAWALLVYFVRDLVWMAGYWGLSALGVEVPPHWAPGELWRDLQPFLKLVGLLVLWLLVVALIRWRLLTSQVAASRQPAPLDPTLHDTAFGLTAETLRRLQTTTQSTFEGARPIQTPCAWNR